MLVTPPADDDGGFTLVELLVAIAILAIVGAVTVSGLARGMRATSDAQNRMDAFNEIQIALERVSRELRAADPIESMSGDAVSVRVHRDGTCVRFSFTRSGDTMVVSRQPLGDASCSTPGTATTVELIDGITNAVSEPVFSFLSADGATTADPDDVAVIEVLLRREIRAQPSVTVGTAVHVRNLD